MPTEHQKVEWKFPFVPKREGGAPFSLALSSTTVGQGTATDKGINVEGVGVDGLDLVAAQVQRAKEDKQDSGNIP